MKKFLKIVLAVICGLLIANLLTISCLASLLGSSAEGPVPVIPRVGALKIDMSKISVQEQTREIDIMETLNNNGETPAVIGIYDAVRAIDKAAQDPGVKFIYLKPDYAAVDGMATLQELRGALVNFRNSGKPIISYMESPTTGTYYLASAADKVYMTEYEGGNVQLNGISSRLIFLGDLLDRLGVNVQLIRHGKYKSAGEMYIRSTPSAENLEQNRVMINAIWKGFAEDIAASRGISVNYLNDCIDNLRLCLPSDFLECSLADGLLDRNALENRLAELYGVDCYSKVTMIPFADYVKVRNAEVVKSTKKIAVIYADGNIVDGLDYENVDGDRFASLIEDVRRDSSIKTVVLRVNSPGGSVVASEKIKHELDLLKGVKPVVASYGNYAASGGYWISNGCDKIFTNRGTLTGSIGVFGMVPDFSGLIKGKAHVGIAAVSSNRHGDMMTMTRPLSTEEHAYIQRSIENIYSKFVSIVAEGRSMKAEDVDAIAQGRVWAGEDAIRIGLADELGTLQDALNWAAAAGGDADLSSWQIVSYPKPMTVLETIAAAFSTTEPDDYSIRAVSDWLENWKAGKCNYAFAAMPFLPEIR